MIHAVYDVTVEPAVEPVRLESLKDSLRITTCDFDEELTQILTAARKQVELDSDRKLVTQTVAMRCDRFPVGSIIQIRMPPVQSITSVTYLDEDEASQTLSSSKYYTDLTTTPPRIWLDENEYWPDTDDQPNAVTVTFVAGYGLASAVPVEAKLAMKCWAKMQWRSCDDYDKQKRTYDNLINSLSWTGVGMTQ